jgi:hypothetical protein
MKGSVEHPAAAPEPGPFVAGDMHTGGFRAIHVRAGISHTDLYGGMGTPPFAGIGHVLAFGVIPIGGILHTDVAGIGHTDVAGDGSMPGFGNAHNPGISHTDLVGDMNTPGFGEMGMGVTRAFGIIDTPPYAGGTEHTG